MPRPTFNPPDSYELRMVGIVPDSCWNCAMLSVKLCESEWIFSIYSLCGAIQRSWGHVAGLCSDSL